MKSTISIIISLSFTMGSLAQQQVIKDTTSRTATIEHKVIDNQVEFTPNAPALSQIAGAPKAFYTHFWEFGDGTFSKENNPKKSYKKNGEYQVRLWATNNYDTGKPPITRPKKIKIENADSNYQEEASIDGNMNLQRNREPVPQEDMVVVFSYKNTKNN